MSRPARPEVLALLADVKENPDDLTPWLVLTDWLEENGDEADRARAEYCRLCFDKLGKKTYASDWEKGERRRELFRKWNHAWLGPLQRHFLQVEKGLMRLVNPALHATELPELIEHEEAVAWVPEITLECSVAALYRSEVSWILRHLTSLAVFPLPDDREVAKLAACPGLNQVRALVLRPTALEEKGARALAESPHFGRLHSLRIDPTDQRPSQLVREILRERFRKALRITY